MMSGMRRALPVAIGLAAALAAAGGCAPRDHGDPRARVPVPVEGAAHDPAGADFPRVAFPDGSRTANDRCMILKKKLNPGIPPIYVNGTPLGFC